MIRPIKLKRKRLWRIDIKDKVHVGVGRFCPPHTFPHKLPFGEKISDEPCHYHRAKWRMAHHKPFCWALRCPHRKFMLKEYSDAKNKGYE